MITRHAALWIDHNEALALALDPDERSFRELAHLRAHDTHTHPTKGDGHRHPPDPRFMLAIEEVLAQCEGVVVFGPSLAKDDLIAHLDASGSPNRARIVAVAVLDRVTEGELAAHARDVFRRADQMNGVHVTRGPRGAS